MAQPRTAKEVLEKVEKLSDKSVAFGDTESHEAYQLMKKFIEKLHPGTSIL